MPGKQDGPSLIIFGPPRPPPPPPPNSPKCAFFTLEPIYEKLVIIFFPCYKFVCSVMRSYCPEIFVHLASPGPPKYEKKFYFFHILGLNLKMSYQIASLFHMYIDMGESIAGKQDRFSLIIKDPLRAPKIPPKYNFF